MIKLGNLGIALFAALLFNLAPQHTFAKEQQSVLVTGASTGIGRNLTEKLAASGYHVYAGARKDKDMAALNAIDNVTAVRLDVTKQDQVDAAVKMIQDQGTGLYALVNNAGIGGVRGTVVDAEVEDQSFIYKVNVEGVYRTTKAFGPLVMASKGRIVTTGSIAGTVSALPGFSAYSGSKHWIEAYTDSLATEMEPHGVWVSVVEPGNYKSNIRRSGAQREIKRQSGDGAVTDEQKQAYDAAAKRELSFKEPDEVSEAFMHALFDEKPLRRYVVVPNEQEQAITIRTKVQELVQLNQWGPYSYSREELMKILDETLAAQNAASN